MVFMMAHFPIFTDLSHRPVLVIGGGHIAEHKVETLLETGAKIDVVAEHLSTRFTTWQAQGALSFLGEKFSAEQIDGHFLVIAATDDHALNAQIFAACEARHTFCNSVDNPQNASFITPAVVNRGALQIAISSGGKAPVLVRLWRARLEKLIPLYTAKLAEIAGNYRAKVKAKIPSVNARRAFWEALFASPFSEAVARNDTPRAETLLENALNQATTPQGGVCLVGAGPGDAGLLTLHALQALADADVVFYDALVSEEVLAMARKDSEKICVGKRAGKHHVIQEETNRLLVTAAQSGQRVVRLKGGDPFVFGRGGEECEVLKAAGIPFRVIPGITAGIGATAYAGIPLTHRDYAQTALFITGHCRPDGMALDWSTLARGKQTLVIYMGTVKADEIEHELITHGRAPTTPIAIISNGTCPNQKVLTGALTDLAQLASTAERPALIVIGEVVNLRQKLLGAA